MLRLSRDVYMKVIGHCYDGLPLEACGLLGGDVSSSRAEVFVPCRNADDSSRTYSIGPDGWAAADDEIYAKGLEVIGVVHSHTHTEAYPSPTDVARADNPLLAGWHFVIVSMRGGGTSARSYLLDGGKITEELVVVEDGQRLRGAD